MVCSAALSIGLSADSCCLWHDESPVRAPSATPAVRATATTLRLGAKLLLPQVVLEEVVNGFQERLEDCLKKAAALREEVRRVGLEGSFALQPLRSAVRSRNFVAI